MQMMVSAPPSTSISATLSGFQREHALLQIIGINQQFSGLSREQMLWVIDNWLPEGAYGYR